MIDPISVEVAYATVDRQWLISLLLPAGATAATAVEAAIAELPMSPSALDLGIFGRPCTPETVLKSGDRVEIYRPLNFDPMESRRRRAAKANRAKR